MAENFAWPQKGNKAFTSGKEAAFFHVPSTKGFFPPHADAFKSAADIILEKCIDDGHKPINDILFLPVAYLYRHYLELRLKAIVQVGLGMEFFKRADVESDLHEHNLARLWTHAKKLLKDRWPDADDAPLKGAESVVQEFHQSDPSGQMFRYHSDKNGRPFKQKSLPQQISPATLLKTMDGVYNFLEATWSELQDNLSDMLAAQREYSGW